MELLESLNIVSSIVHVSRKSGRLVTSSPAKAAKAIRMACAHWAKEERAFVTPELRGAAPWLAGEMKIYELGKALGLTMRKLDLWMGDGEVMDAAAAVLRKREYGRGRQTFALLLGAHGGAAYADALGSALRDDEIAGYAMKALLEGGHGGFAREVRAAAARSDVVWVQIASQRYLARFDASDAPSSTVTPRLSTGPARPPDVRCAKTG